MNILLFCNYFSIWMILSVEFFFDLNTVLPLWINVCGVVFISFYMTSGLMCVVWFLFHFTMF